MKITARELGNMLNAAQKYFGHSEFIVEFKDPDDQRINFEIVPQNLARPDSFCSTAPTPEMCRMYIYTDNIDDEENEEDEEDNE